MKRGKLAILVILLLVLSILLTTSTFAVVSTPDIKVTKVSQSPDPVEPGQTFTVKFKIENEGTESSDDVIVRLNPSYPFTMYGDDAEKNIGKIRGSDTGADAVIVEFDLKVDEDAVEGDIDLDLEVEYGSTTESYTDGEFTIDVQTHDAILFITDVTTTPEKVKPGEVATIEIMVQNLADSLLKDIIFELDMSDTTLPFAPYQSSSERRISNLNSGYQKSLKFTILTSASATAGMHKIPLNISYNDENGNSYSLEDVLAIQVGKQPEMKAYVKKTDLYQAGQSGTITLELANFGVTDINYLQLDILDSEGYKLLTADNYFYIGNLDSDDTESEDIDIYVYPDVETVSIPIKLTYLDDNNQEYQQTVVLELDLYSKSDLKKYGFTDNGTSAWVYIFLILIIAGGVYYYFSKKKSKKKK